MKRPHLGTLASTLLLALITLVSIFPFFMMVIMSTLESQEVVSRLHLLPGDQFLTNGAMVIQSGFILFYWNSFFVAAVSSVLGVLFSAAAAFALAKYRFPGRKLVTNFVLLVMMIPFGVSIVGYLIEMRTLGWSNTHAPLIIAALISPYGVFLLTQFAKDGFPMEILESARVDGCGELSIFFRFFLPFTKAACFALLLLIFMFSWNNFLIPLVFLTKQEMYTIPLGIFAVGNQYRQEYGARMFALAFSTLPMLILFALNSKNLVSGLTAGAVKG